MGCRNTEDGCISTTVLLCTEINGKTHTNYVKIWVYWQHRKECCRHANLNSLLRPMHKRVGGMYNWGSKYLVYSYSYNVLILSRWTIYTIYKFLGFLSTGKQILSRNNTQEACITSMLQQIKKKKTIAFKCFIVQKSPCISKWKKKKIVTKTKG